MPILNFSASTYEAIIAAFVVLGLIQSVALRRKAKLLGRAKQAATGLSLSASKAIVALMQSNRQLGIEREIAASEAMRAYADLDNARDELNRRRGDESVSGPDFDVFDSLGIELGRGKSGLNVAAFRVNPDGSLTTVPMETVIGHPLDGTTYTNDNLHGAVAFDIDELLDTLNKLPPVARDSRDPYADIAEQTKARASLGDTALDHMRENFDTASVGDPGAPQPAYREDRKQYDYSSTSPRAG